MVPGSGMDAGAQPLAAYTKEFRSLMIGQYRSFRRRPESENH
jgi:hypothetical protein